MVQIYLSGCIAPVIHAALLVTMTAAAAQAIPADHPLICYSDYIHLEWVDAPDQRPGKAARFNRTLDLTGKGYGWDSPGTRIAFRSDATAPLARLYYSPRHRSTSGRNGKGFFLIDGRTEPDWTYQSSSDTVLRAPEYVNVRFPHAGAPGFHHYEIVLPYGDSVEFLGLDLEPGARLEPFPVTRTPRYVAYGDSITHGFTASRVDTSYAYLVADHHRWQLLNLAIAGRSSTPGDGKLVAALNPDLVTVLMGGNDWQGGVPLATYRSNMLGFIRAIRASQPAVPVFLITPLWVPASWKPDQAIVGLDAYRAVLREIASQSGDLHLHLVEGPDLIDHDERNFDRVAVHPNDLGFAMMARRLSACIRMPHPIKDEVGTADGHR